MNFVAFNFPKRRSLYCYLKYLPDHRIESTGTFYLIYTKSSQFNPKGYFINLMTFTFCQFLPIKMTFIQQSKAFLAGLLFNRSEIL